MKGYVTFFLIAVMSLGLIFLLVTRDRSKHDAPAEIIEVKKDTPDSGVLPDGGAVATTDAAAPVAAADAAAPAKPTATLRVTALGWELAAAGVAMSSTLDAGAALSVELAPETSLDAIEARLARGGSDPQGADIAVMPLPAFVSSFERLRALEPRAFLVVGFSHGREQVNAAAGALLKAPPAADEVKIVGFAPATASDASAKAGGSESATVLGLFALDLLGVAPARVRFVAPAAPEAKGATFAAIVKGASDERKPAFSTADASRLVPIVAIAPKALLDTREAAVREWSTAWLTGLGAVKGDVPGTARKLASKEGLTLAAGVGGAPEALVLVERLGQIESATLAQQTSFVGALAKGPVTLDSLMQKTWQLERAGGFTTNAAPDPLPTDARVVTMIAPPPPAPTTPAATERDGGASAFGPIPASSVPLVAYRTTDGDAEKVATQIAFLANVFERGVFKVSAKGGAKAAIAIATAARDKGVDDKRLGTVAAEPTQGAVAVVEVLSPP